MTGIKKLLVRNTGSNPAALKNRLLNLREFIC